jgi:hypothetical protein
MKRLNPKTVSEVDVREQHHIKIPNRFSALENLNDNEDLNMTSKNMKDNTKIST